MNDAKKPLRFATIFYELSGMFSESTEVRLRYIERALEQARHAVAALEREHARLTTYLGQERAS